MVVHHGLKVGRRAALVLSCLAWLAGCASEPEIPEGQLSAEEIRRGVEITEDIWIAPLSAEQRSTLADAHSAMEEGDLEAARSLLEQLLEARPEHPDLLANAGIVAWAQKRPDAARTFFENALKFIPGHRVASNNLALLLREQGRFLEARKVLIRALERHPEEPKLHYNLALIYEIYLQDPEKALEHYQRYQALAPEPDPKVKGWIVGLERRIEG